MRLLCLILTTLPWSIKSECQPWCLVSGWKCDDVSARCLCDFDDRNVEWCLDGQSQSPFYSLHQASKLHLDFDDLHYLEITSKNKLKHVNISVYGISRRAVAIVGPDGYLALTELSDCIFEEENDLGLSLWLRYGDSYDQILFTIGGNTRNTSRMLMYLNSSNPESLFVDFQAGNKSTSYTFTVPWNIWTYVALSWNASEQSLTVMINGELIDTLSYVVCFGCSSEVDNKQIVLGKSPDVNCQFTNVFFDELALYCKPLGLEEVKSNYTFYKGLPGLQVNYTLLFPSLIWKTAEKSLEYIGLSDLQETLYSEISDFYSSRFRKEVFKDTWIYQCKNMMGRVSCDIGVTLMSTNFNSIYILNSAIKWNWLNFSAEISTFANNDVPSKLVKLEGVALGNSSILIQWTNLPEALLNGILQGFKISYTHELSYSVTTEMVYRYINNFTLSNLEWYTTHYIKFFVLTLEGQGVVNYLSVKTGMIAPLKPPDEFTAEGFNQTCIKLKWKKPPGRVTGIYSKYLISYWLSGHAPVSNVDVTNITVSVDPREKGSYTELIRGLQSERVYSFKITAFTVDYGPFSDPVSALASGVPIEPLSNVMSHNGTSQNPKHTCFITWEDVPAHAQRGTLLSYVVTYRLATRDERVYTVDTTVPSCNNSVVIEGLEMYSTYIVTVAGLTSSGYGVASDPVYCYTDGIAPTGHVTILTSSTHSKHSCLIGWGPVDEALRYGQILGYNITYNGSDVTNMVVDSNTLSAVVSGLDVFTQYVFTVRAFNKYGLGNNASSTACRTGEGAPPEIPRDLAVLSTEWEYRPSDSCELEWSPVTSSIAGTVRGYAIRVYNTNETNPAEQLIALTTLCVSKTTYNLTDLSPFHMYNISISAFTTEYGEFSQPVSCLTGEARPHPPNISCQAIGSDSIRILIETIPMSLRNGIIRGILVEVHQEGMGQVLNKEALWASQYHVHGLKVYTNYTVRVAATTLFRGNFSGEILCTTNEGVPATAPLLVSGHNINATSINVTWSPLNEIIDGILRGYSLFYRVRGAGNDTTLHVNVTIDRNTSVITDLQPSTEYRIEVSAFTGGGYGPKSAPIFVFTDGPPPPPKVVPTDITETKTATTSRSCAITWILDPGEERGLGGHNIYWRRADSNASAWQQFRVESLNTSYDLTGLEEYTEYMIRVSLFNLGGQGNLSEVLTCTTKQDGPSAPPQNVTATVTSPNAIIISFGKIPSQDENGIVQYYRICVYEKELGITFMQCIQVNNTAKGTRRRREVAFDMYSKALTGLKPHTEYVIQVHGHTIKDGVYSDPITITTDEDVPTLPPENVMVFNTSTTSLKLQWGEIASGHLNGVLRAFNITYWPTNDPNTITNISITAEQALGTVTVTQGHNITTSSEAPTTRPSSETPTTTSSKTPTTRPSSETPTTRPSSKTPTTRPSSETPTTRPSSETPTSTSSETPTTRPSSETPTKTSIETPTTTSSETPTKTSSETPTKISSETPTKTSSETPTKTSNETPTKTSSETPTKTSSETPTTTSSETPTTTSSETPTTRPSSETPTKTFSERPTKTSSETPTKTSSETPTTTSSETPTTTSSETPTKTSNKTPTARPSSEAPTTRPSSETPTTKPPEISLGRRRRSVATPTYSWELTGLKIWTDYTVQINGFTIGEGPKSPEMNASTDMGVPSSPPDDVTYDVLSPSSIIVRWKPVPVHHRNGIIQGYRLRYQTEMRIIIVNLTADQYSAILTDLDRVANYTIFMSAFTRSGEGNSSYDFIASDSFGPKTSPINLTAENWVTPSTVPVYWMPLDEPEINEKLMGYRISWRPVSLGDVEVRNAPWENATVRKDSPTKYIIRGLLNYARYEINVAGFTRGGDGPSDSDHGETCRCHKRIAANYRVFPPYVIATVGDASVNMSGMIPEILDNLTVSCCRTCLQHGKSYVDFFTNGHGDRSYQLNSNDVRDLIDSRNELSFPVYGWKDQNFFDGEYPFIPLVESPGFAFLVKSPEMGSVLRRILISIMDMWPIVAVTVLMALLAGVMIWVLDTTANPEHFPSSVASGLWNGWWWAFITMTTLGYGDRVPKTNKAKVFAIVWILVGLVIFGILNGSLTSAFTSIVFTSTTGLYNTKVAALSNTPEYHFGVRMQAMVNTDRNYSRFTDVVQALTSSSVHGILIDAYEAGYKRIDLAGTGIRIQRVYDRLSTYGVVLSGPSVRLHQCSRNYMTAHKAEMFAHIEKFVLVVEAEDFNELVELSTGLFDKESEVFKQVMMYTLALIAVLTSFALLWEVYRLGKKRKFSDFDAHQAKRKEMEVEIRDFINAFCTELTVSLSAMKQQHLREQLALVRNQEKSVVTYNNMESFT